VDGGLGRGGGPITKYTVTANPDGKIATTTSAVLTAIVAGLTNGTSYTFTVTATNAVGTGAPSLPSNSVTPAASPGPPTNVAAAGGVGLALVTWQAPVFNGGSPITQYQVTSSPGAKTAPGSSGVLSARVFGLNTGTNYTFVVTASNAVGTSSSSTASNSILPVNGSPTVTASSTAFVEGSAGVHQLATFTDVEIDQAHTATIDWGDGSTSTGIVIESAGSGAVSRSHVYPDDDAHTVTVTVMDGVGGVDSDSLTVTVNNAPPTVNIASLQTLSPDLIGLAPASYNDLGAFDTHTAIIDWGDGSTTTATVMAAKRAVIGSHQYTGVGSFTITVTVTVDDGGSGSNSFSVDITTVPTVVGIPFVGAWGLLLLAGLFGLGVIFRARNSSRNARRTFLVGRR
jgi:hypothetical protein